MCHHEGEVLPRQGECKVDVLPQGILNEGTHGGGCEARRQSRRKLETPPWEERLATLMGVAPGNFYLATQNPGDRGGKGITKTKRTLKYVSRNTLR